MANEFKVRKSLVVNGSGSVLFDVQGSQGQLFSITDSLLGSLFSVKDISGMPVMEAFSDNTARIGQFGQKALFVSQSRVGIGKETLLNANLDISGSTTVTGSVNVSGSLTTTGTITAQTLVVQTITSSVEFASGSNQFGSLLTDTQTFTGSVGITGSLLVNGPSTFTGSIDVSGSINILSGSLTVASASLSVSGSLSINGVNITATGGFQQTFAASTTWVATHNLNTLYPVITVYNGLGQVIIPTSITATNVNTTTVTFNIAVAGTINIISGQLQQNIAISNPSAVALSVVLGG
jgi:cytoskeletal protein CcmA (bactofilin family)